MHQVATGVSQGRVCSRCVMCMDCVERMEFVSTHQQAAPDALVLQDIRWLIPRTGTEAASQHSASNAGNHRRIFNSSRFLMVTFMASISLPISQSPSKNAGGFAWRAACAYLSHTKLERVYVTLK